MPVGRQLKLMRRAQQLRFLEIVADQLQADRHAVGAEAGRHAHAGQARQAGRQGVDVGQVVGHRVVRLVRPASTPRWATPGRR